MRQARGFWFLTVLALTMVALAAPLFAATPHAIADTSVSAASIEWRASGVYDRLVLKVSGPNNFSLTREYEAGIAPALRVQDLGAKATSDGSYNWELQLVPHVSAEVKKKMAEAREAGDDEAASRIQAETGLNHPMMQSGTFSIQGGAFVTGGEEPRPKANISANAKTLNPATNDQVIADDLIVQGSECVGLDCVNNESFGFDTLRLKENNTRIKFDDTSTSTGFPNHDWQLTANDSASGGANKFSIEDITAATVPMTITGSSPTNSIFVDSSGRLGLRTATPVLDVHIATSNTPAMRYEQNNSGGFTAQTWDVAGNEANFFVRDVTGGSRLPFRIRPGAPTSSIDISASGNVGVGTASPSEVLHLNGAGNPRVFVVSSNNGTAGLNMQVTNGSAVGFGIVRTENNGDLTEWTGTSGATVTERVAITAGGNVGIACTAPASKFVVASGNGTNCTTPSSSMNAGDTQFTAASSRTFKENIAPVQVPDILEKIKSVPVYNYDFVNGPKDRIGLIAEDFHQVFGRGDAKYINGGEVQIALWLAVQQLTAKNDELTKRLGALEAELATAKQPAASPQAK